MRCSRCGSFTKVIDSRIECAKGTMVSEFKKNENITGEWPYRLRKRVCRKGHTTVTMEIDVADVPRLVKKVIQK